MIRSRPEATRISVFAKAETSTGSYAGDVSSTPFDLEAQKVLSERLQGALKGGRLALFDWQVGTDTVYTNDLWLGLLGYCSDDMEPGFASWQQLIHPEDLPHGIEKLNKHLDGETDYYETVVRMRHKNGGWRHMRCAGEVLERTTDGAPIRMIGTQQDITALIETQQAYEKAASEAEAAVRAKSAFLSNMSHEIRTPLNGIVGMLELIALNNNGDQINQYVDSANECAALLDTLIGRLLEFGRLENNADNVLSDTFNPKSMLANIAMVMESHAIKKGLVFQFDYLTGEDYSVVSDEGRLAQIVNNLLANAIKFTDEGAVGLRVQMSKMPAAADRLMCDIEVWDTGIGIPEDQQEAIFGRFEQLETGHDKQRQGVGLGLSIVQEIVRQMEGEIKVSSVVGQGTRFRVQLPMVYVPFEKQQRPSLSGVWQADPGQKALVAEDNPFNLRIIEEYFRIFNLPFEIAETGREAIEKCAQQQFDLILMDICMPDVDGVEATQVIKSSTDSLNQSTPILGLTANGFPEDIASFTAAGMDSVLVKPYKVSDLQERLQAYLG